MLKCQQQFNKFYERISLSSNKIKKLKKSRNAVRDKIKNGFKNKLEKKIPLFYQQGSWALRTILNQISGENDLDDGVYLDYNEITNENEILLKTETIHEWIKEAAKDHTFKIIDKKNCVRVVYSGGDYHIDLPIYSKFPNGKYYLARKGQEQWIYSDPKQFKDWFYKMLSNKGEQSRTIIKYLKAWIDYNDYSIPGIIITVLGLIYYIMDEDSDGNSLLQTVSQIINELIICNGIILNPVDFNENFLERFSNKEEYLQNMIDAFKALKSKCEEALYAKDTTAACNTWREIFGERFPLTDNSNITNSSIYTIPTIARPYAY